MHFQTTLTSQTHTHTYTHTHTHTHLLVFRGLKVVLVVKNPSANAEDMRHWLWV